MNILRHTTVIAIAACLNATMQAQEPLSKEITVEKEIIPQEREASRLFQQPQLVLPAIQAKKLRWTDRAVTAPVTPGITVLPPNKYAASVDKKEYKGYFDIGYFPAFQLGASAGYRFVNNETTMAGAWLQYDGSQYKRENIWNDKIDYKDHTLSIGASVRHNFEGVGTLSASLGYGLNCLWFPAYANARQTASTESTALSDEGFNQTANRFGINANWESRLSNSLDLTAGMSFGHFAFSKPAYDVSMKALNNSMFSVNAGARYSISDKSMVGADLKYASTSFSQNLVVAVEDNVFSDMRADAISYGVVDLHPYFMSFGEHYSARLGFELSAQTGEISGVNIGPDVRLDWMPSQQLSVYAQAQAGYVTLNTLPAMMDRNHYINPSLAYTPTRMKGQLDLGLVIGPFAGASFEIWGGMGSYANVNMPVVYFDRNLNYNRAIGMYSPMSLKSYHYGIAFRYNYKDMFRIRASYEGAPQEYDKGYLEWQDRAKGVLKASLTVTPIKPLDITVGYEQRIDRAILALKPDTWDVSFKGFIYDMESLGNVNSLNLVASYRFNDKFTVWATVENLLGEKWQLTYGIPNVGLTGLVGIGYKF